MQMAEVMAKVTAKATAEVTAKATAEVMAKATAKAKAEIAAEATAGWGYTIAIIEVNKTEGFIIREVNEQQFFVRLTSTLKCNSWG
jgi:hypothetical protein